MGDLHSNLIHGSLSPQRKRHLDHFSRFCRAHDCEWQTDHTTQSEVARIYMRGKAMQPNNTQNKQWRPSLFM